MQMSNQHSRMNVLWRRLTAAGAVFAGLSIASGNFAGVAAAASPPDPLVVYDSTGSQCSCNPVAPAFVAAGLSATNISQIGMLGGGGNNDVWPVGQVGPSKGINLGQYVSLSVTPSAPTKFETVTYSKRSYSGQGPRSAAVRTSLDGFGANIASVSGLNPAGFDQITFSLASLPITSSNVEFRIYFFNAPSSGQDWADLVSTNGGGAGLILIGEVYPTTASPTPTPAGYDQTQVQPTAP